MKKVLIISAVATDQELARSRTVQFARALYRTGNFEVDFITLKTSSLPSFVNEVFYIKKIDFSNFIYKFLSKIKKSLPNQKTILPLNVDELGKHKIYSKASFTKTLIDYIFDFFVDPILLKLDRYPIVTDYDFVFSSYSPFYNLSIASQLKRKQKNNTLFIYDFRDPVVQSSTHPLFRRSINRIVSRIIEPKDLVTSVTQDCLHQLNTRFELTYILSNGYEDIKLVKNNEFILDKLGLEKKRLNVLYAGTLYDGRSDLSPILLAMEHLAEKLAHSSSEIQFIYVGNNKLYFDQYYGLNWSFDIKSFDTLPRDEVFGMYEMVEVIVISSWKYKNFPGEGEPSSKVYELLNLRKPLIALINKDSSDTNTDLRLIMHEYGHQNVYEFSNDLECKESIVQIESVLNEVYCDSLRKNTAVSDKYHWDNLCNGFLEHLTFLKEKNSKSN